MTSSISELRNSAESFRKLKDYTRALPLYKSLWEDFSSERTKWDGWGYALCLNHFKKYDESLKVCKETYAMDKNFKYIKSQYSWAAYQIYIFKYDLEKGNLNDLLLHGSGILRLTDDLLDDLARRETVFKIVEVLETKGKWNEIIEWLSKLDVNLLSDVSYLHTLPSGRNINMPSPKAKWYSKKTKALEKNENFNDCLKLTSQALQLYEDDVWLIRRKAISLGKLGKRDEAITILIELAQKKHEWFIYKDIADLFFEKSDFENSLKFCYESCFHAIKNPNQENLWELYFTISRILKKQNQPELAKKYCLLSGLLRIEQKWKVSQELQQLADALGVKFDANINSSSIVKQLSADWKSNKYSDSNRQKGTIKTILPNGKSGFIRAENGTDFFFMIRNFNGEKELCVQNAKVVFYTEKSFDKKKNQESEIASNISLEL